MVITTREQRVAIKRIFDRGTLYRRIVNAQPMALSEKAYARQEPMTYRQFRGLTQPVFFCDGAVTVPWAGMWLCIERDGYTHS